MIFAGFQTRRNDFHRLKNKQRKRSFAGGPRSDTAANRHLYWRRATTKSSAVCGRAGPGTSTGSRRIEQKYTNVAANSGYRGSNHQQLQVHLHSLSIVFALR